MSHRDFARPGTNINTVEGNKAGGRAARSRRQADGTQAAQISMTPGGGARVFVGGRANRAHTAHRGHTAHRWPQQ